MRLTPAGIAPEQRQKLQTLMRLYGELGEDLREDWTHRFLGMHSLSGAEGTPPEPRVLAAKVHAAETCCKSLGAV